MLLTKKESAVIITIIGWVILFVTSIFLQLSLLEVIGSLLLWSLFIFSLHNILAGFLIIITLRASLDFLSSHFSLSVHDNITLNLASILGLFLITLSLPVITQNYKTLFKAPLKIPFILFILFGIFSISYSINQTVTIQEVVRIISIFVSFLMAYILTVKIPKARNTIILTILLSSLIPVLFAIYQLLTGTGFSDNTGTEGRLFGTFTQPNAFASFLLIIISLFIYKIFSTKKKSDTQLRYKILVGFFIILLLLTFSRGGWLAFLVFFTLFSIFKSPKLLLFALSVITLLLFTSQTARDRLEDVYNPPADSSIRWRIQQWKDAINAWQLSPIYGFGAGTEIQIHEQEKGFYSGNPYTHNDFIKTLQEVGIIGCLLFIFLIISTIIQLIKKYLSLTNEEEKMFVIIVLFLFISGVVFGMSSNIWRGTAVQWLIWILVACALSVKKTTTTKSRKLNA